MLLVFLERMNNIYYSFPEGGMGHGVKKDEKRI